MILGTYIIHIYIYILFLEKLNKNELNRYHKNKLLTSFRIYGESIIYNQNLS